MEESPNKTGQQEQRTTAKIKRLDLHILIQGKQIGLSFLEMNELTTQDYLDAMSIYAKMHDASGKSDQPKRRATQADIDALLT